MSCKITALLNGPLKLESEKQIIYKDGLAVDSKSITMLCTCGKSKKKPFCDYSHAEKNWHEGDELVDLGAVKKSADP